MPDSPIKGNQDRITAALAHVSQGFGAFSVWSTLADGTCKCPKGSSCTSPGKHPIPRTGFKAASTDPTVVTTMLSAGSEPNYGLVVLDDDDIIIIDVDGAAWKAKIADLVAEYGPLPKTKTTKTPSGGLHIFYRWPAGVPMPDGDDFHGFVCRYPFRGYVVGPGSTVNGKAWIDAGIEEIATLPLSWAQTRVNGGNPPLIVVTDEAGYEMPDSVETGHRHDEITRLVASLWNRRVPMSIIFTAVEELSKRFVEPMDRERLTHEIDVAYRTANKKWETPGGGTREGTTVEGVVVDDILIDPLAIESQVDRPVEVGFRTLPIPTGLALLLDHYTPLTDAPHSSLALASMVVMSALVGPAPTLRWRGNQRAALFGCLVGDTGYGRKGATMREVERAFMQVDPLLREIRVSGIASGEALIDVLAESKTNTLGTSLIWEHEIAGMLKIAAREGNIMSSTLRAAWDGDQVQSRSRAKGTTTARDYNVAFLGGVTPGELAKRLTNEDVGNGWANRFLWFYSEKRPGGYDPNADSTLNISARQYVEECIEFGRRLGGSSVLIKPAYTMTLAPDAQQRMEVLAESLDIPPIGAIGALRQRMPAHMIRLAMVSAVLDQSSVIGLDHVIFAEAMARYAVDSMRAVFGVRVDDPLAMLVLSVLAQAPDGWMNTTTLRAATGDKNHSRLMSAVRLLLDGGLIVREDRVSGSGKGGRPSVGYRLKTV